MKLAEEIENSRDDSIRMYKTIGEIRIIEPKKKVIVHGENGLAVNEKEQINIITNFFRNMFQKDSHEDIPNITPREMTTLFNLEEIVKAATSLYKKPQVVTD